MAKKTTFKYNADATVHDVKLCGNFTNWEQGAIFLNKGKNGEFRTQLNLNPGEYEYKYVVDGNWQIDPSADFQKPNDRGSENSVKIVR